MAIAIVVVNMFVFCGNNNSNSQYVCLCVICWPVGTTDLVVELYMFFHAFPLLFFLELF